MTVGRLLSEVSSYELSEWQAFLTIDREVRKELERRAREDAGFEAGLGD